MSICQIKLTRAARRQAPCMLSDGWQPRWCLITRVLNLIAPILHGQRIVWHALSRSVTPTS